VTGIALVRGDAGGPVGPDIHAEQLDCRRIHVRCVNEPRPTSFRDEDGERTHAGERVRDHFAFEDAIGDSLSFRSQPGAEVCLGKVDAVVKAIFRMHGRRPPLARDDLDRSNSSLALHPSILHGDPDLRIPSENRESNFLAVTLQLFGDFQDGDISDHIKGGGKGSAQSVRHFDHVFVASNGNESRAEFPLFHWETKVDSLCCREEQPLSLPDDA